MSTASESTPRASRTGESPVVPERSVRRIALLGATGSIGTSTIDVVEHLSKVDSDHDWHIWAASGHRNLARLGELAVQLPCHPDRLIVSSSDQADVESLTQLKRVPSEIKFGADALIAAAQDEAVHTVVAAIVGRAGLESTLAAVRAGKRVALANKETLVVAGPLVNHCLEESDAEILPVDSEHSAIFQCIGGETQNVKRLVLTASGGPFRTWSTDQMRAATPDQALAHPTWQMGKKISIDSATMMNKALEIIEARWLFDVPAESIDVAIHPQSMIHSMVEFTDNSTLAQVSPPDMRLPIQYALTYPRRLPGISPPLSIRQEHQWELIPADRERFPALELGFEVARVGGTAGAVVNAANEQAVELFLEGHVPFTDIVRISQLVLSQHTHETTPSLGRLLELDDWARKEARRCGELGG